MHEYLPVLIVGGIIGLFTTFFLIAYAILRRHKEDMTDRDRNMSDKEIVTRLLRYAKPYWKSFIAVFFIMLFSIVYEVVSPLLMGTLTKLIQSDDFGLNQLFTLVGVYAGILIVSLICT